jgi:hypothetical protein
LATGEYNKPSKEVAEKGASLVESEGRRQSESLKAFDATIQFPFRQAIRYPLGEKVGKAQERLKKEEMAAEALENPADDDVYTINPTTRNRGVSQFAGMMMGEGRMREGQKSQFPVNQSQNQPLQYQYQGQGRGQAQYPNPNIPAQFPARAQLPAQPSQPQFQAQTQPSQYRVQGQGPEYQAPPSQYGIQGHGQMEGQQQAYPVGRPKPNPIEIERITWKKYLERENLREQMPVVRLPLITIINYQLSWIFHMYVESKA